MLCDLQCENCEEKMQCTLNIQNHKTLLKVNSEINQKLFELKEVKVMIQYSLKNERYNYPVYIGEPLGVLFSRKENIVNELTKLYRKKESITYILRRRGGL
ncbi:hypothetical protein [uncultured Methanobrevibacter sp.]|uniref:hypothetical protein n=1 Tax=uncultured Methanobrevibacter sp. TaxID=253161 RepID=UPI00261F40C9|nr:hypothetical protein [uncultured Methanobrevibacter sp.]